MGHLIACLVQSFNNRTDHFIAIIRCVKVIRTSFVMGHEELKEFLDAKVLEYNNPKFLEEDPISIPHSFSTKEDIEISGFLTATIAWGNRKSIIQNSQKMMELLHGEPYNFIMNARDIDLDHLAVFVHRTFNGTDLNYFVRALRHVYREHAGLEALFAQNAEKHSLQSAITAFKKIFFEIPHPSRSLKHVSDPSKGSAAKR